MLGRFYRPCPPLLASAFAAEAVHAAAGAGVQAPLGTVSRYDATIANDTYKVTAAAATELDWSVMNVTTALKAAKVWGNTVMIFVTDNGGPLDHTYNQPLRGGKHTYWEGGVRGEAFVFSELLTAAVRGSSWGGEWFTNRMRARRGGGGGRCPLTIH